MDVLEVDAEAPKVTLAVGDAVGEAVKEFVEEVLPLAPLVTEAVGV